MNTPPQRTFTQRLIWPGGVFFLLGSQLIMCGIAVVLASNDPTHGIEPDYYQKAVDWDQTQAAIRASGSLGWKSTLAFADETDTAGRPVLTLSLQDAHGGPIKDATRVQLLYFHHAVSGDRRMLELKPAETPGVYAAPIGLTQPGVWEFQLRAEHASGVYLRKITEQIN